VDDKLGRFTDEAVMILVKVLFQNLNGGTGGMKPGLLNTK
jgi:hypothetical protein